MLNRDLMLGIFFGGSRENLITLQPTKMCHCPDPGMEISQVQVEGFGLAGTQV